MCELIVLFDECKLVKSRCDNWWKEDVALGISESFLIHFGKEQVIKVIQMIVKVTWSDDDEYVGDFVEYVLVMVKEYWWGYLNGLKFETIAVMVVLLVYLEPVWIHLWHVEWIFAFWMMMRKNYSTVFTSNGRSLSIWEYIYRPYNKSHSLLKPILYHLWTLWMYETRSIFLYRR